MKKLIELGPWFQTIIAEYAEDQPPERKALFQQILASYKKASATAALEPLGWQDNVETRRFPVVGRITNRRFAVRTSYGRLNVAVSHVRRVVATELVSIDPERKYDHVAVRLLDDVNVKGKLDVAHIVAATPYGMLRLPIGHITTIRFNQEDGTALVQLCGGDEVVGVTDMETLNVKTPHGMLTVLASKVASIDVYTDRIDDALAYHWSFDNEDAVDSLRGVKGQIVGDVRFAKGILGKAPVFKNHSTKIVVQSPEFSVDGWKQATFSAWLKPSHYRNYGYAIGGAEGNQGSGFSFTLGKSAAGFVPYLAGGRRLTTRLLRRESDFNFQTGVWYHLVGTYDGHRSRFYINGNLEVETVAEEPGLPLSDLPNARFVIGRAAGTRYDTWYDTYFPGPIDELKIWRRAMNAAEVKQLYQHTLQQSQEDDVSSKSQVDYAGLRWDLMRTGWKVEDGKLVSQRHARPGFQYGHGANGRGGCAITGIGDKSWVDYEVAFDFKMLPANREFFHAHIPGDSRGMSVPFRIRLLSESWNQPHTCYSFGLSPTGNWSMGVSEDYHMPGHGWSATRKGEMEKLASGKSEACQDASQGRLRLRVKGSTITVWLNDEKLVEHTHKGEVVESIPYGGFGVQWRYESMGWISDLAVKKL